MVPGLRKVPQTFVTTGYIMSSFLVVAAASALLGLISGLIFRVWAMAPVSLIVAVVSAVVLHLHGFGFLKGVLSVTACLFITQGSYFIASVFVARRSLPRFLAEDSVDNNPGDNR